MGLGGWMVQEGYMMQTADFASPQHKIRAKIVEVVGEEETAAFYDRWLRNHVTKADIDALAEWGFNSVRLPMHYNLFTLPIEDEPIAGQQTWLDIGFELTDSIVSWCSANDMYVILDLHAAPGGQGYDAAISDYDDTKPSLWESKRNRDKTVALWKRIAERYADEEWIAGYDLLNEPNWDLPGGTLLRSLYGEITDSIRTVDQNHILFIEGNWFANDFTGLTPPWDDKLVYSPHKYWSYNDKASIQWVLDMRETYNVPLYLGESGENSNVWFTDAIKLLDEYEIGWAWWPLKKIESISCPLSINKSAGYDALLSYWRGDGPKPSEEAAVNTLQELTDNILYQNCTPQPDVPDAMIRQVGEDRSIAYMDHTVPGKIYAVDFDLGGQGVSYYDQEVANYHLSTGNFTAWNNGWAYRNDGVDIEPTMDDENTIGYNVGWTDAGEWMRYSTEVSEAGIYDVTLRMAGGSQGGRFRLGQDGSYISEEVSIPLSGGFQSWIDVVIEDVVLEVGSQSITAHVIEGGYNISSYTFDYMGPSDALSTVFLHGVTTDSKTISVAVNKPLDNTSVFDKEDFSITINGMSIAISEVSFAGGRSIEIQPEINMLPGYVITVSHDGSSIKATDGSLLESFTLEPVQNTLAALNFIPGRLQAEDYSEQSGLQLEETTDSGGGQNIGYTDPGDFADYEIVSLVGGTYDVTLRTAGLSSEGGIKLSVLDDSGQELAATEYVIPATGGWQSWQSISQQLAIPEGSYTLRMEVTQAGFNLNWMDFAIVTGTTDPDPDGSLVVYPNPTIGEIIVNAPKVGSQGQVECYSTTGQLVLSEVHDFRRPAVIDLSGLRSGIYLLKVRGEGHIASKRIVVR